ncbi:MAG: efflux RND transporter periplasmic adaptor subunit [Planctomycetaceae bacterium]
MKSATEVRIRPEALRLFLVAAVALAPLVAGCSKANSAPPPPKTAEVRFVLPEERPVQPFEEIGGRTGSPKTVELRSRVTGYLTKVNFQEGTDVKEGDVLFEIDDSTYKADLAASEAMVNQRKAEADRSRADLNRTKKLAESQATTQQQLETMTYQVAVAEAAVGVAESARDRSAIDVQFTRIVAPISGRIGRRLLDPGNLVIADETPLATIVSLDPIYAYFDFDERSVLAMRRLVEEGVLKEAPDRNQPVLVSVAGEEKYDLVGRINWVDNQIDLSTGTLRARVEIANSGGLLSPGMFVRLRVPLGPVAPALLIPEEALGADQGQRFVYVVNGKDEIEYRRVEIGWLTEGKVVIKSGIQSSDRIVVTGLQRVRPKAKVIAKPWTPDEPSSAAPPAGDAAGKPGTATTAPAKELPKEGPPAKSN